MEILDNSKKNEEKENKINSDINHRLLIIQFLACQNPRKNS